MAVGCVGVDLEDIRLLMTATQSQIEPSSRVSVYLWKEMCLEYTPKGFAMAATISAHAWLVPIRQARTTPHESPNLNGKNTAQRAPALSVSISS